MDRILILSRDKIFFGTIVIICRDKIIFIVNKNEKNKKIKKGKKKGRETWTGKMVDGGDLDPTGCVGLVALIFVHTGHLWVWWHYFWSVATDDQSINSAGTVMVKRGNPSADRYFDVLPCTDSMKPSMV